MKIGIIGAGNIGTGIGKRLVAKGHHALVSYSRSPDKLLAAGAVIGTDTRTGSVEDAALFGDVVLLATPWAMTLDVVRRIAPMVAGKIVWDATNPLTPDLSGLALGTTTSGGESVAAAVPGARVVKAVPPFAEVLQASSTLIGGQRPGIFVCSDDAEARRVVLGLVDDIEATGVDAGPLSLARCTEPLGLLLVRLAYGQGFGARIGAALLQETHHG